VTLLQDPKRALSLGLKLASLGMRPMEICRMLADLDFSRTISPSAAQALMECLPNEEERKLVAAFAGDPAQLVEAEQFFYHVARVPDAQQRIRILQFRVGLAGRVKELRGQLQTIRKAATEARGSPKFKQLLQVVLFVGNRLNRGGKVKGFTIKSLLKLSTIKSFDDSTTMLRYIEGLLHRRLPEVRNFVDELGTVPAAAKEKLSDAVAEVQSLKNMYGETAKYLDGQAAGQPESVSRLRSFMEEAAEQLKAVQHDYDRTERRYKETLKHFGEDPGTGSEDFFEPLFQFMEAFKHAHAHNSGIRAKLRRKNGGEAKKQGRAAAGKGSGGGSSSKHGKEGQPATPGEGGKETGRRSSGQEPGPGSRRGSSGRDGRRSSKDHDGSAASGVGATSSDAHRRRSPRQGHEHGHSHGHGHGHSHGHRKHSHRHLAKHEGQTAESTSADAATSGAGAAPPSKRGAAIAAVTAHALRASRKPAPPLRERRGSATALAAAAAAASTPRRRRPPPKPPAAAVRAREQAVTAATAAPAATAAVVASAGKGGGGVPAPGALFAELQRKAPKVEAAAEGTSGSGGREGSSGPAAGGRGALFAELLHRRPQGE